MPFLIRGLEPTLFSRYVGLSDSELHALQARRVIADCGYPDRVELRDAYPGESLLLVNYEHQPAASPYRASHAIYVLEHATAPYQRVGEIPSVLRTRIISLRAFDDGGMLVGAELCAGDELERPIEELLDRSDTAYLHLHYAKQGCFACRVDRV